MYVRFLAVLGLLLLLAEIVTVGQAIVVVLVGVPVSAVVPRVQRIVRVVMRDVVMVVAVRASRVRVLGLFALVLGSLRRTR